MIDAHVCLTSTTDAPNRIAYHFTQASAFFWMIVQLMAWNKTQSGHEIIKIAVSQMYEREREIRIVAKKRRINDKTVDS